MARAYTCGETVRGAGGAAVVPLLALYGLQPAKAQSLNAFLTTPLPTTTAKRFGASRDASCLATKLAVSDNSVSCHDDCRPFGRVCGSWVLPSWRSPAGKEKGTNVSCGREPMTERAGASTGGKLTPKVGGSLNQPSNKVERLPARQVCQYTARARACGRHHISVWSHICAF